MEAGADPEAVEGAAYWLALQCFLIEPRSTSPAVTPPTVDWAGPSPFFVFRSPSPSLPRPRRPDPEEAAAVAAAEFSVKAFHFYHPLPSPPHPLILFF